MPVSPRVKPMVKVIKVPSGTMIVEPLKTDTTDKRICNKNFDRTTAGLGKEMPIQNGGESKRKRKRVTLDETPATRPSKVRATAFPMANDKDLGVHGSTKFMVGTAAPVRGAVEYACVKRNLPEISSNARGTFKEAMQNRKDHARQSYNILKRREERKRIGAHKF